MSNDKQAPVRRFNALCKRSAVASWAAAGSVFWAGLASRRKPITITARRFFPLELLAG